MEHAMPEGPKGEKRPADVIGAAKLRHYPQGTRKIILDSVTLLR